jgi:glutaredoxin
MQIRRLLAGCLMIMAGLVVAEERPVQPSERESSDIVLFSQPYCPGCEAAKHHFMEQQIPYREFDISESAAARETFERLGGRGTPFLLIQGKRMQGFSIPLFEHYIDPGQ